MGAIGKQSRQQGMDASGLSQMLGQESSNIAKAQPQGMQMLGALLDSDGDEIGSTVTSADTSARPSAKAN